MLAFDRVLLLLAALLVSGRAQAFVPSTTWSTTSIGATIHKKFQHVAKLEGRREKAETNRHNNHCPIRAASPISPQFNILLASFNEECASNNAVNNFDDTLAVTKRRLQSFNNLFPLWTVLMAGAALKYPSVFQQIPRSTFPFQLGLNMLCMGISLKLSDFRRAIQQPGPVAIALFGCYGLIPALAIAIGKQLKLDDAYAAGLVLVACVNGAQASNLCTYIGQGDLPLNVLMTTSTTVGAIILTPLMIKLLLGATVPVDVIAIAISTIQVIVIPLTIGIIMNEKFPKLVKKLLVFSPTVGVAITTLLVGESLSGCANSIIEAGLQLQVAAALLHISGGIAGYVLTKPFFSEDVSRTFAIQFSMKSSATGFFLASSHFPDFAMRVPSAASIVWMTLVGSILGVLSRFSPPDECRIPEDDDEDIGECGRFWYDDFEPPEGEK